jgi:hypothetical protein
MHIAFLGCPLKVIHPVIVGIKVDMVYNRAIVPVGVW